MSTGGDAVGVLVRRRHTVAADLHSLTVVALKGRYELDAPSARKDVTPVN